MKKKPGSPMTGVEAEALAFAREWVANFRAGCGFTETGGLPPLHPDAGHAMTRHALKCKAMLHPFHLTEVIVWARAGWEDADIALRELIAEHVDHGRILPAQLAAYLIEAVHPKLSRLPGRQKADYVAQDLTIVAFVSDMVHRFPALSATRNNSTGRNSISSIVAIAITEAKIGRSLTGKAVEAIWARHLHAV